MLGESAANSAGSGRRRFHHRKSASETFAWAASAILTEFAPPLASTQPIGAAPQAIAGADRSTADGAGGPSNPNHALVTASGSVVSAADLPFGTLQAEDLIDILGVDEDELDLDVDVDVDVDVDELEVDDEGVEGEHQHQYRGLVPAVALEMRRGDAAAAGTSADKLGLATVPPAATLAVPSVTLAAGEHVALQQHALSGSGGGAARGGLHRRAVSCTAATSSGGTGGGGKRGQSASSTVHARHVRNPSDSLLSAPAPPVLQMDKPLSEFAGQTRANALDPALLDPKRAKRIIANRQSAHRSRMKKLQVIHELEQQVATARAAADVSRSAVAAAIGRRRELLLAAAEAHYALAALRRELAAATAAQAALVSELQSLGVAVVAPPAPPGAAAAGQSSAASGDGVGSSLPPGCGSAVSLESTMGRAVAAAVTGDPSLSAPPRLPLGPAVASPAHALPPRPSSCRGAAAGGAAGSLSGGGSALTVTALPGAPREATREGLPMAHGMQLQATSACAGVAAAGDAGGGLLSDATLSPRSLSTTRCSGGGRPLPQLALTAGSGGGAGFQQPSPAPQLGSPQHAPPFTFFQAAAAAGAPAAAAAPVPLQAGTLNFLLQQQQQQQLLLLRPGRRQGAPQHLHRRHMSAGCAVEMDTGSWSLFGCPPTATVTTNTTNPTTSSSGGMMGGTGGIGGQGLLAGGANGDAWPPVTTCINGNGGDANVAIAIGPVCGPAGDTEMSPAVATDSLSLLRLRLATASASLPTYHPGMAAAVEAGADAAAAAAASAQGEAGGGAAAHGDAQGDGSGDCGGSPMALDAVGALCLADEGQLMCDVTNVEDFLVKEEPEMELVGGVGAGGAESHGIGMLAGA